MKILNFDESIFRLVTEIPYYVGQHIMQSPIFVKEHLKQFIGKLENFVCKNFTMDKLLWAYKAFSELMNVYRQQSATLRGPELLHHVVHDLMELPCDLNAKKALSGKQMTELLKELGITDDRRDIEFCVRYVVGIADELQTEYRDVIALLVGRGYMDFDQNEAEFCKQYKLSACTYTEFVLYGIRRTVAEGQNEFWRKYGARPKTVYDELLVANCVRGTQSLETFTTTAPPSDTSLSANFCRQVASSIDPANHSKYSNSQHLSLPNNISVLCDSSVLGSVRIVLFYVHSTPDRPRSLNVCIYNKSKGNPMLRFP